MKRSILLLSAISLLSFNVMSQGQFDDVVIKETKLTENIYMLEGSGGNIGVYISEHEVLMIDDQYGPLSEKIMSKIKELSGATTTKLINTHWHGDHSGGNENFAQAGAMIFAHENVRTRMSSEHVRGERITPPSPEIALPVVTFTDNMKLHFMGEPILVSHVHNAHTDGDSFIFLTESNVLHMGDCFFHKRFPYIDISSGGSINGMISATEAVLMIVDDETQIIPGHGPMANKKDLQKYHKFLTTVRERVIDHITNGREMDTIDPDKIVEGYEDWSWGFINAERFTNIVFDSLSDNQ